MTELTHLRMWSIVVRVTTPRVDSSKACSRTLKRRSNEIGVVRDVVSKRANAVRNNHPDCRSA